MLKSIIQAIRARVPLPFPSEDQDIPGVIETLRQEDPRFAARLDRALLIILSDQEIFARYAGYAVDHFDMASALNRLVMDAGIHARGLKQGLPLQVDEVISTGRRYTGRGDVENAFKSHGLMIGLRR